MFQGTEHDELLDLVDDHDQVIGRKRRSQVYQEGLSNFRVVNAFLMNRRGELWVPRRTAHKRICPGCLDTSIGGHVTSGEDYEQAMAREAIEELNLDWRGVPSRLLGYLSPTRDGLSAFMRVWEARVDTAPDFNRQDFVEAFWLSPRQALESIEAGTPAKDDLPKLIRRFYGHR